MDTTAALEWLDLQSDHDLASLVRRKRLGVIKDNLDAPDGIRNGAISEDHGSDFPDAAHIPSNPTPQFEDLDWNGLDITFLDFQGIPDVNEVSIGYPELEQPAPTLIPTVHQPTPSPSISHFPLQQRTPPLSVASSIPALPSLPRLITRRPAANPGMIRTNTLILHTLKSYLLMIQRDNILPPFIHSQAAHLSSSNDTSPEDSTGPKGPLSNCLNLIPTLSHKSQSSRKTFWGNVRGECERICTESRQLSKWDLLSAMQALSIYIIVRLDEGDTEDNNLDFLLLAAVTATARAISANSTLDLKNLQSALSSPNTSESWKEWIFEESRRRLAIIYRILYSLIYFAPAADCDRPADLLLAPLPAKKQLWEAADEGDFKREVEKEDIAGVYRSGFGIDSKGDLVRLDKRSLGPRESEDEVLIHTALDVGVLRRAAKWEEWCVGMDGMGGIVLLAASLV
ncbi:hypothetical protein BJY04DRAFT_218550 [Aspergillus karnatakaensis]|uniref:uncharacterized protein n=1 Tax=Aspergillus karnatakaensis TaxID=1810916 RepID=UPI003CCE3B87